MEFFGLINVVQFFLEYFSFGRSFSSLEERVNYVINTQTISLYVAAGLYVVCLVFGGIGMTVMAKKVGMKHSWLAFLPFANTWYAGKLAGETQLFGQKMKRVGLYAALAERGFFPKEDLTTLRHTGSYLQGHPDMKSIPGVDMSSGSLGQGVSAAVGMAIAAQISGADYRVYTLLGDGEIQEGQVWEAAMLAGHRKLDNLVVIVDNNNLQIDGAIDQVNSPYPIDKKFGHLISM